MAGNYDRYRILSVRCAHSTKSSRRSDFAGKLHITNHFAIRDSEQRVPYFALEWRTVHFERQFEFLETAFKIPRQLARCFSKERVRIVPCPAGRNFIGKRDMANSTISSGHIEPRITGRCDYSP